MSRRHFATVAGGAAVTGLVSAAAVTSSASADTAGGRRGVPRAVELWAKAWNTGDSELMGSLFTEDGTYTDFAFQASFTGRDAVAQWVPITLDSIEGLTITVLDTVADRDRAAVRTTFAGTFNENSPFPPEYDVASRSFSVPAVSYFRLTGRRIRSVEDHYNLADVMRQVGLPVPYIPPGG